MDIIFRSSLIIHRSSLFLRFADKGEVPGYVAAGGFPLQFAIGGKAIDVAGDHIVLGIADEDFLGVGVDGDAVGNHDVAVGAVLDNPVGDDGAGAGVDDAVGDGVLPGVVAPFHAVEVDGVAGDAHVGDGDAEGVGDFVGAGVNDKEVGVDVVVVAAGADVDVAPGVNLHAVEVDGDVDVLDFLEGLEVDDGDGAVVVGDAVAAGVGDVELAVADDHLLGLVADDDLAGELEGGGVDLGDEANLGVGVDGDLAGVGADVGLALVEDDVAAVGDLDGADVAGGGDIDDLDVVRAVDDGIDFGAVDLDVVADVAEFLDDFGVALGIDVAGVGAGLVVEVVDGGTVHAHVALIELVESLDPFGARRGNEGEGDLLLVREVNDFILAASRCQQGKRQGGGQYYALCVHHIFIVITKRKFLPGMG